MGRLTPIRRAFFDLLSDPARFAELEHHQPRDYVLGPGRYLMLGDNSPWSRDARAWGQTDRFDPDYPNQGWDTTGRSSWEVPESLLIGKAFCVYWPHPKPVWPRIRSGCGFRLCLSFRIWSGCGSFDNASPPRTKKTRRFDHRRGSLGPVLTRPKIAIDLLLRFASIY